MPDSTKKASESEQNPTPPVPPTAEELADAKEENDKAAEKQAKASSKTTAKDDDYDPGNDPLVPDSALADVIRVELATGESPTLDALRAAHKEAHKNDEK